MMAFGNRELLTCITAERISTVRCRQFILHEQTLAMRAKRRPIPAHCDPSAQKVEGPLIPGPAQRPGPWASIPQHLFFTY